MLVGQLYQTLQPNLIFLQRNRKVTSVRSVLLNKTDGGDKVQPDFTELSDSVLPSIWNKRRTHGVVKLIVQARDGIIIPSLFVIV